MHQCRYVKSKSWFRSGEVTLKGKPVPAGYTTFQWEGGSLTSARSTDGLIDPAKVAKSGAYLGPATVRITGFDSKKMPYYYGGKQLFNPYETKATLTAGVATMDFDVPASAANNLKIEPTAGIP